METDVHISVRALLNNPIQLSPRVQRVSIFSILLFPINAAIFHVKAERNRWIPVGQKNSFFTGRLRNIQHHILPVLTDNVENQVAYMDHEWCSVFMNPCDSLLPFLENRIDTGSGPSRKINFGTKNHRPANQLKRTVNSMTD